MDRTSSYWRYLSFPPDATADEIEAIVAAEGVAVVTGEQPVPRHREIIDRLAKHILAQLGCR